jgi:hypothetical protein
MFLSMMATKYNLKCNYKFKSNFKKLGISFFKGKKEYAQCIEVTEKNFIHLLKEKIEPANLVITNDVWFQTKEFTQIIYNYYRIDKVKTRILDSNVYYKRYNNNNDLFIHIRLGDVKEKVYELYDYYDKSIDSIDYEEAFITSDNLEDPFCQKLIRKYGLRIYLSDEINTIMFGNTCAKVLMSGGTFSWLIGFLGYYTKDWYYPSVKQKWYGNIFLFKYWKQKMIGANDNKIISDNENTEKQPSYTVSMNNNEPINDEEPVINNINNNEDIGETNTDEYKTEESDFVDNGCNLVKNGENKVEMSASDSNLILSTDKSPFNDQVVDIEIDNNTIVYNGGVIEDKEEEKKDYLESSINVIKSEIHEEDNTKNDDLFENVVITKNYDLIDSD